MNLHLTCSVRFFFCIFCMHLDLNLRHYAFWTVFAYIWGWQTKSVLPQISESIWLSHFLTSLSVSWRDKQAVMIFRRKASLYWSLVWLTAPETGSHFSDFVTLTACGKIWTALLTFCGHYSTGRAFTTQCMGQNPVRGSFSRKQTGCGRVWMDGPATNEYAGRINQGPFLEVCAEGRGQITLSIFYLLSPSELNKK